MHETFEHTADIGLRARSQTLNGLFEEAAKALFSVIVANPETIQPVQQVNVELQGDRDDDLLYDWLSELLYLFDARRLVLAEFRVRLHQGRLEATAHGEPLDRQRHEVGKEVKAITYHALKVERDGDGYLAEVIVDL